MVKKLIFLIAFLLFLSGFAYAGPLGSDGNKSLSSSTHTPSAWSNSKDITITWKTPSAHSTYGAVTGYCILLDTKDGTVPTPGTDTTIEANATSKTVSATSDGQSWYFHIRVLYQDGNPVEADQLGPFWIDSTAPSAVSGFAITKDDTKLVLNWTNPGDTDFAGVVIRRDTTSNPSTATAGTAVTTIAISETFKASNAATYTDTSLTNDTKYYYSIFSYDQRSTESTRNYSSAAKADGTPQSTGGSSAPPKVSSTNPADKATDVAVNIAVSVVFDKDMNKDTIDSKTFTVTDAGGTAVSGSYTYTSTSKTAKFTPTANLSNEKTYTVTVLSGSSGVKDSQGTGLDGNASGEAQDAPTDNYSFTFSGSVTKNIPLVQGWNLISLPVNPSNTATGTVLNGIAGAYSIVWAYINGAWKGYDPSDAAGSDLTTMEAGNGYWIKTTSAQTLQVSGSAPSTSLSLIKGWNLVGYNKSSAATGSTTALAGISSKLNIVWAFINGAWKGYDPLDVAGSDMTEFAVGYGYWIKTTEAATWTLP